MILDINTGVLVSTAVMFVLGFLILFVIYYFTAPFTTEFGDKRSRTVYSLVNALYFSIVLSIGFAILPGLSTAYGVISSLLVGLVIVFVFTVVQVLVISELVKRGILKMRRKTAASKVEPKGKR